MINPKKTIVAIATAMGEGAISILRLSGENAIDIADKIFSSNQLQSLTEARTHHQYLGEIREGERLIDEVLLSIYRAPHSYTGENAVEIYCHGSMYIQEKIFQLLVSNGAHPAEGGEFTMRAYLNKKMDLSQAEAVADLIASQSASSHQIALQQMRGGFSLKIKDLRQKMIDFTSLLELELDFSEEDIEFANRKQFIRLIEELTNEITTLLESFQLGNVIKKGIPVAIIGEPNVGKSTLLNAILNEERAIVSDIPGTTRDTIEDIITIGAYQFRFMDTAGLRESDDSIEKLGVKRAYDKFKNARIILAVFDSSLQNIDEFKKVFYSQTSDNQIDISDKLILFIGNKNDISKHQNPIQKDLIYLSSKEKTNIEILKNRLTNYIQQQQAGREVIINNLRHYEALQAAKESLKQAHEGFETQLPTDLISIDIRSALHHLGEILGEISTPEILENIFSKFCIGK
jgi:tRNA modification GTPase